jgi:hypothetical protein
MADDVTFPVPRGDRRHVRAHGARAREISVRPLDPVSRGPGEPRAHRDGGNGWWRSLPPGHDHGAREAPRTARKPAAGEHAHPFPVFPPFPENGHWLRFVYILVVWSGRMIYALWQRLPRWLPVLAAILIITPLISLILGGGSPPRDPDPKGPRPPTAPAPRNEVRSGPRGPGLPGRWARRDRGGRWDRRSKKERPDPPGSARIMIFGHT